MGLEDTVRRRCLVQGSVLRCMHFNQTCSVLALKEWGRGRGGGAVEKSGLRDAAGKALGVGRVLSEQHLNVK